jgi:DNA mismatch endonuclease (patch repair protein)
MSEVFKKAWAKPELRKEQSDRIKKFISKNPEARARLKEFMKGNIPWNFGKKTGTPAWNRGIPPSKEQIEKQRETIIKTFLANPEIIKKIREARLKQVFPVKDTIIETLMQKELEKRKIKFKKHIAIIGQPDIFIEPNLCIFCDGDYWHANPRHFKESRTIVGKRTAKQIWENDKKINNELNKRGFKIFRFWESDIKRDVAKCVDKIEEILKERIN